MIHDAATEKIEEVSSIEARVKKTCLHGLLGMTERPWAEVNKTLQPWVSNIHYDVLS